MHPNDHVNASQSSNDVIPTAIHVAAYGAIVEELEPALAGAGDGRSAAKARDFDRFVKIGRTHLQDAVPIRLGQEFSGYASQVENASSATRRREAPRWPSSHSAAPRSAPA